MKVLSALLVVALFATSALAELPLQPENFAHRGKLATVGSGPFHQLVLPLAVYQGSARPDLADLRVFNARGEALPHALLRSEARSESQATTSPVPFFPLLAGPETADGDGDLAVTVRRGADGTLIAVRQGAGKAQAGSRPRGIVIDAARVAGRIRSLRLEVGPSRQTFLRYTLESSADLQRWRLLKADGQLVHLEHAGQRVDNNVAEWEGGADKYLRLLWADPSQAPEVRSVLLGSVASRFEPPLRLWSEPLPPSTVLPNVYEYSWVGQMPLDRLRLDLPQVNALAPLDIQHQVAGGGRRRHQRPPAVWESLARTVVYRLQSPAGEIRSADVVLSGLRGNRLRLVVDARSGGLGAMPPTLRLGFVPHVLVFLARGDGPYLLAWGASPVERADLPVATLIPGYDGRGELPAATATLGLLTAPPSPAALGAAKALTQSPQTPGVSSKWVLWSVLLAGLLVLAAMVRTLTRQMRQSAEPKAE
ncbi:MAG: hypothetical protein H6R15_803 [Proteobacteria bacterium]|nr:hypothetical protein [Pseudomonadota bacterium]